MGPRRSNRFIGALAPLIVLLPGAAESAAPRDPIVPHRAVYAIGLARTDEGSGVTTAKGRMVFEITGGACQGYNMRQRMVVNIGDEEGNLGLLDFRIVTFESADGGVYDFDARTKLNKDVIEAVQGQARRSPSGIEVTLKEPTEKVVELDGNTLFPSQHLRVILDAALADRNFVAAEIYEGAGDGEDSDSASAAIGKAVLGGPGDPLRSGVRHWPVSVGYFGRETESNENLGEEIPSYQMRFTLYENGVTNDLVMDYGKYALSGSLEHLEPIQAAECPSAGAGAAVPPGDEGQPKR